MGISMRKTSGGKNRTPHIITFIIAIVLALLVVGFLPLDFQIKKTIFFFLIPVFSIIGIVIPNLRNRRK